MTGGGRWPIMRGCCAASLERWAAGTDRKFTLLAHSMGGLVSRSYMAQFPAEAQSA